LSVTLKNHFKAIIFYQLPFQFFLIIQDRLIEKSRVEYDQKITRNEFDWALDCVQTRNCRVPLGRDNKGEREGGVEGEREGGDSISLMAPFFDLMNHDAKVNTVFELKNLPIKHGFGLETVETEPVLTVRYRGHGVKKGEQVSLNYRWYVRF
jgi:hypothetical protein